MNVDERMGSCALPVLMMFDSRRREWCGPVLMVFHDQTRECACPRPVGTRGGCGARWGPCAQYISLKALPQTAQRREDQAGRQNRETAPQAQRAPVEAPGASSVCICCRPA